MNNILFFALRTEKVSLIFISTGNMIYDVCVFMMYVFSNLSSGYFFSKLQGTKVVLDLYVVPSTSTLLYHISDLDGILPVLQRHMYYVCAHLEYSYTISVGQHVRQQ